MEDCIFCKIVRGEIPSYKVYDDDDFMAFLDIAPLNRGHVQVIPKRHFRWVWDVPNFGDYWEAAKTVALASMKGLGANLVEFLTHGIDVEHAHIWIVPIFNDEAFIKSEERKSFSKEEMENIAEKIISKVKIPDVRS